MKIMLITIIVAICTSCSNNPSISPGIGPIQSKAHNILSRNKQQKSNDLSKGLDLEVKEGSHYIGDRLTHSCTVKYKDRLILDVGTTSTGEYDLQTYPSDFSFSIARFGKKTVILGARELTACFVVIIDGPNIRTMSPEEFNKETGFGRLPNFGRL